MREGIGFFTYTVLVCVYFLYTVLQNNYLLYSVYTAGFSFTVLSCFHLSYFVLHSSASYSLYCTQVTLLQRPGSCYTALTANFTFSDVGKFIFCSLFLEKIIFYSLFSDLPLLPPPQTWYGLGSNGPSGLVTGLVYEQLTVLTSRTLFLLCIIISMVAAYHDSKDNQVASPRTLWVRARRLKRHW